MAQGINKQVIQTWWWWGWATLLSWTFNCDFWNNTTNTYTKTITVTDANCTTTKKPIVTLYNADTRDADEIELVQLKASVSQVNNGNFVVIVSDDAMQAEWTYTFNYILI